MLGLHRPIDHRFGPVPGSRSESPPTQLPSRGSKARCTRHLVASPPLRSEALRSWDLQTSGWSAVIRINAPHRAKPQRQEVRFGARPFTPAHLHRSIRRDRRAEALGRVSRAVPANDPRSHLGQCGSQGSAGPRPPRSRHRAVQSPAGIRAAGRSATRATRRRGRGGPSRARGTRGSFIRPRNRRSRFGTSVTSSRAALGFPNAYSATIATSQTPTAIPKATASVCSVTPQRESARSRPRRRTPPSRMIR